MAVFFSIFRTPFHDRRVGVARRKHRTHRTDCSRGRISSGVLLISRTGPTTNSLVVSYSVGGTATSGLDYTALSGSVTISNGSASATITVMPVDDALAELSETVVITLARILPT